ncbi:MAG TPA: enoyl-CoA hydratase/isomerase family protein [Hyphomicrobiales bacterium]|nr:enoyl-CoA hydratase/isomerase family protein [Hyphomicrobiales bacterium]
MPQELIVEREDFTKRLFINRAERGNALNATLVEALIAAVAAAATGRTRLLTIEGIGSRFCSGFDFTGYEDLSEGELLLRFVRIEQLLQAIYHAPFLTAALAHGSNFGAGADIVAACSIRIASPDATFRMPGLRFGVALGTRRLAQRVGVDRARQILQGSLIFGAKEAKEFNFLTAVASREEWPAAIETARKTAENLSAGNSALLLRLTANDSRDADMADLVRSLSEPGLKQRIQSYRQKGALQ